MSVLSLFPGCEELAPHDREDMPDRSRRYNRIEWARNAANGSRRTQGTDEPGHAIGHVRHARNAIKTSSLTARPPVALRMAQTSRPSPSWRRTTRLPQSLPVHDLQLSRIRRQAYPAAPRLVRPGHPYHPHPAHRCCSLLELHRPPPPASPYDRYSQHSPRSLSANHHRPRFRWIILSSRLVPPLAFRSLSRKSMPVGRLGCTGTQVRVKGRQPGRQGGAWRRRRDRDLLVGRLAEMRRHPGIQLHPASLD